MKKNKPNRKEGGESIRDTDEGDELNDVVGVGSGGKGERAIIGVVLVIIEFGGGEVDARTPLEGGKEGGDDGGAHPGGHLVQLLPRYDAEVGIGIFQDRQELLQQKGCVIWITGLSGSGKSTLACALSRALHSRGKFTYILDGDNIRHGLNQDLGFKAEDRAENIRRIGEVAKLFADAGIICIASLISPYRRDRDACRALLPEGDFIEVFMHVPLHVCETRDPKGLYKLARSGKIKGFTGIDDPYEPPLNCEIVLQDKGDNCTSPCDMAEIVISYLQENGYLQA